ncbi:hypothetical protein GCM10009624_07620 [Gordonia sinesedis]
MTTGWGAPEPNWGADPGSPTPQKSNRKTLVIIGAVVGGIILMCGSCGVGSIIGNDASTTATPSTVTRVSTTTETTTVTASSRPRAADDSTQRGLLPQSTTETSTAQPDDTGEGDDDRDRSRRAPLAPPPPQTDDDTSGNGGGGGASGPFSSCSEARAAGQAPLYRGDPGYSPDLDRDGDGTACESG